MANKQKLSQKGLYKSSRRSQNEKSQRNVNIIKHFQPNVQFNKHLNCDLPEVNADVETKENFKTKCRNPSITVTNVKKTLGVANKEKDNSIVQKIKNPSTKKVLLSQNEVFIPSGSSSSKDFDTALLKNITSVNSLIIPTRSSLSSYISPSSNTIKKKNYHTKKAKTCSIIDKKKSKIFFESLKDKCENDKISSTGSLNKSRNLILDLKREIIENQTRTPSVPINVRNSHAIINSQRGSVEHLRNEIKNLINSNLFDKRKRLAEIKADISNFRNTNVLVYNVNVENNKYKSNDEKIIENIPTINNNATDSSRTETPRDIQQLRCNKTYQFSPRKIERKSKTQMAPCTRTIIGHERVRSLKPKEGFAECQNCPNIDDSIISKIDQTNTLIHKLQQTLNEIRYKSHPSTPIPELTTTDTEADKSVSLSGTDAGRSTPGTDEETVPDPRPKIRKHKEIEVEVVHDRFRDNSSPETLANPCNTPVISPLEPSSKQTERVNDALDSPHEKKEPILSRPKTRRNSAPDELCDVDRFQNTPKNDEEAGIITDTEFQILQSKLNTINEQTESDISFSSEAKHSPEKDDGANSDSSVTVITFQDTIPKDTASVSTQCVISPNLIIETPQKLEITPKPLNKTTQLVVQLLPPVNITNNGLAVQKLVCFSIDRFGKTHIDYKSDGPNVGYFETQIHSETNINLNTHMKQSSVRFSGAISIPLDAFSQDKLDDDDEDDDDDDDDSSTDPELDDEIITQNEEIQVAEYLPDDIYVQTDEASQEEESSIRKSASDTTDISHQLKLLYCDTKTPFDDDNRDGDAESCVTVERLKTGKDGNMDNSCEVKKHSSFNLIDANHPKHGVRQDRAKEDKQKFIAVINPHQTTGKTKKTSAEVNKDLIFESFQLVQNNLDHNPGALGVHSADMISTMDESIYKTFINPLGFQRFHTQGSSNKSIKKKSNIEKLSSFKFPAPDSKIRKEYEESKSDKQTQNQSSLATEPSKNTSKLYNIGLYSSKSTQFGAPLDEVALRLMKQGKLFLPEVSPDKHIEHIKSAASHDTTYETISLTVSYSTEESSDETPIIASGTKKEYQIPGGSSIVEQDHQIGVVEHADLVDEPKELSRGKKPNKVSHGEIQQDVKKFKQLKKKINEEHNIVPSQSLLELTRNASDIEKISASIPNFISGLITTNTQELQIMIPHVRKTVQGAKRRLSECQPPLSDKMKNETSTEDEEKSNTNYTVLPVQVQELQDTPNGYSKEDHVSVSPLVAGKNGRYEDEANCFCENNHPRIEETLERRFKYNPANRRRIDSSNSDTISEKTLSEGEIRCSCSVSIGEMHRCEANKVFNHRRPSPFQREERTRFRKKKTYFDNCVTFYLNKNASMLNDSSSTS